MPARSTGRCGCDPSARGQNHRQQSADRCRTKVFTDRQGNASRCLRCRTFLSISVWIEFHGLHWPQIPSTSQKSATTRIERWRLRLTPLTMALKYRPGRNDLNPNDYVSRQPQDIPKRENAAEAYVNYVCKNAVPKSMMLEEVCRHRKTLWWESQLKRSRQVTDYSVSCSAILRDHRLIISDSLRKNVIEIAHASHQGIVKTKQLIKRESLVSWDRQESWTGGQIMHSVFSVCTQSCSAWTTFHDNSTLWSMDRSCSQPCRSLPIRGIPFCRHCRFPEVDVISSTSAKTVVPHLDMIFSRHAIPDVVKTDNGPPFNGNEFQTFSKDFGFQHRKITPLRPEANGEAEWFMACPSGNSWEL